MVLCRRLVTCCFASLTNVTLVLITSSTKNQSTLIAIGYGICGWLLSGVGRDGVCRCGQGNSCRVGWQQGLGCLG